MKVTKSFLFTLFILMAFTNLHAQYTDVINSNRPGVSQSAYAVGAGVLQFETGLNLVNEEHTPLMYEVKGFGVDFVVRYGLFLERLELQLDGMYQNDTFTDNRSFIPQDSDRSNFKRFAIGAKYLIYDPYKNADEENKPNLYSYWANRKFKWKNLIPAVAIYAGVNIDSKDNPYVAPDVEGISPRVLISTQNNFPGGWVLVMNFIKDRFGSDFYDFEYVITLTHSFNPQWAVFGEAQGLKGDFYADNIFRLGGAYLWNPNFQLDTAVAFNTKDTPSVLNITLGASYRFDWHVDKDIDNGTSAEDEAERQSNRKKNKRKKKNNDFDDDGNGGLKL